MIFEKHQVWFEFLYNFNPNVPCAECNNHFKSMYTNDALVMKTEHTIPSSVWQGSMIDLIQCWFLNIFVMKCVWKLWYIGNDFLCPICIVHGWQARFYPQWLCFSLFSVWEVLKTNGNWMHSLLKPVCFAKRSNLNVYYKKLDFFFY